MHKVTAADILLIVAVFALLPFVFYQYYWQDTVAGDRVFIYVQNKLVKKINLHKDQHIDIEGVLGKSRLQIADGKIRFIDSPCIGKVCIHKGWHSHSGDFNACLPNQVSFEIISDQQQFDSINF